MARPSLAALALVCTCSASGVRAQPTPPTLDDTPVEGAPGEARTARAKELFKDGLAAARLGAWDEARRAFEAAYGLSAAPAVLFNLAGAQRRSGRLLASHANYRRFASLKQTSVSPEQRKLAAQLADDVEASIPRLRLVIDGLTTQDRVLLDHQRIYGDELGRDLWLDPGAHTLQVERASGDAEVRTLTLHEREVRVLSMRLPDLQRPSMAQGGK